MDMLFQLLETDHERITELLSEMMVETDPDQVDDLFEHFLEELEGHMEREEEYLYPHLEKSEATMPLVQEAYEEHDRARQLVESMADLPLASARWRSLLREVKDQVGHHFHYEEHQVFPRLHNLFPPEKLDDIYRQMTKPK